MVLDISSLAKNVKERLKGNDNYLTTETFTTGAVVLIIIVIIVTLLISPASFRKPGSKISSSLTPIPSPSPTPTPIPLPRGPREYGVGNKYNPQLRSFKLSEFAPKIGEKQELTLKAIDTEGGKIVSIEVKLITDHKEKIYPMKLISGTSTDGEWFATWITDDTHDYKYNIVFTAINDKGQKATINPTFR